MPGLRPNVHVPLKTALTGFHRRIFNCNKLKWSSRLLSLFELFLWSTIKKSCFLQSYFCNVLEHFTCTLASDVADVLRLVARDKSTCLFAGRLFQDLVRCGERSSKDWGLLKELWDHQGVRHCKSHVVSASKKKYFGGISTFSPLSVDIWF